MLILTNNTAIDMPLNTLMWAALATFAPWLFFVIYAPTSADYTQIPTLSRK
jgi:hypothetical protein